MSPTPPPAGISGWKESGGLSGPFSPNAAEVQSVVALTANTTYSFKLRWKTNRPAMGVTIYAGAGPLPGGGGISPSRLTVQLVPAGNLATAVSSQQYSLANSDGAAWQTMDPTNLIAGLSPVTASTAVLSANADLWTANAGFNQDIGIFVSVNGGADQLLAWKESGGFGGVVPPHAALLQGEGRLSPRRAYGLNGEGEHHTHAGRPQTFAGAGPVRGP